MVLSISDSIVFLDYLQVATAVVVPRELLPHIDIALIFFLHSGPLGVLVSDGKQNTVQSDARGRENCCTIR